jgi:hypothetical protein
MRWQKRKACHFDKIILTLPIVTLSEANTVYSKTRKIKSGKNKGKPAREHWREAWIRHKDQKKEVHANLLQYRQRFSLPCFVRLIRLGPRELDFDNLVISQKYIRDAISEMITGDFVPGRADGNKKIKWEYEQEISKSYGVRIEIYFGC